jgi:membrane-associated phospholipid phosphatase
MKYKALFVSLCVLFLFSFASFLTAQIAPQSAVQTPTPTPTPTSTPRQIHQLETHFIQNVFKDQGQIWTAPFKLRNYDSKWALPIGFVGATLLATDRTTSRWVGQRGSLPAISRDVSLFGQGYSTAGVAAGFYVAGRILHNDKARETGVLALQSFVDTAIVTDALKVSSQRLRPDSDNGSGEFWDGGSSFPSGHASSIWSVATVIAYEYQNHPWVKYPAFAAATAVALSRYSGRKHFLSDITAGSAIGFWIGRYVYKNYHDPNLDIPKTKSITKLRPTFIPYYYGRTRSYGGSLNWSF